MTRGFRMDGLHCEACGAYVPTSDFCGNDRADGTSEYLCPDCYVAEREDIDAIINGECDWA